MLFLKYRRIHFEPMPKRRIYMLSVNELEGVRAIGYNISKILKEKFMCWQY